MAKAPGWDTTPRGSRGGNPSSMAPNEATPRGSAARGGGQAGSAGQAPTDPSVRVSGPQLTDPSKRVSGG